MLILSKQQADGGLVVARVDGLRVVLEAETGFNRKAQAIKDADARLKQGLTVAAFAVCYPLGVTEETLHDATLTWTLRTRAGLPAENGRLGIFRCWRGRCDRRLHR